MDQPAPLTRPRKPGRPVGTTKKTPQKIDRICKLLAKGLSFTGTAGAVGLDPSTIHTWRKEDPAFAAAVQEAISASEEVLLDLALAGAKKDGRVALMMLERRHGGEWAKREVSQHQHLHAIASVPAEFLATLAEARIQQDHPLTVEATLLDN